MMVESGKDFGKTSEEWITKAAGRLSLASNNSTGTTEEKTKFARTDYRDELELDENFDDSGEDDDRLGLEAHEETGRNDEMGSRKIQGERDIAREHAIWQL